MRFSVQLFPEMRLAEKPWIGFVASVAILELRVPDIGPAEQIDLVRWTVAAGADVALDQELCELVTDKAAFPLEAPQAGRLLEIQREAGSVVQVGDVLALLEVKENP